MSEERRGAPGQEGGGEPQVKVVDRRRFRNDGAPVEGGSEETARTEQPRPEVEPAAEVSADPRDAQLAAQQARIDELSRAYAALVEDNKAFRQRLERERTRLVEAERVSVAQALLEAADDLERALAAVSAGDLEADALGSLVEGVRLSLGGLHKRIAELGAQKIPVQGQRFDPHIAEAIDVMAVSDAAQDGVMLHEIRPGYRIGERILRPARVRVGRLAQA